MTERPTIFGYQQAIYLPDLDRTRASRGDILAYLLAKVEHGLRQEIERTRPDVVFDPARAQLRLMIEYRVPEQE